MKMLNYLRSLKHRAQARADFARAYLSDARRFFAHSQAFVSPMQSRDRSRARLMLQAHALEKGMAMPEPRPGFGETKAEELFRNWRNHVARYGSEQFEESIARVLLAFIGFKQSRLSERPNISAHEDELRGTIACDSSPKPETGLVRITRDDVLASLPAEPEKFFVMRRSLRQFSPEPVPQEVIERALRLAQRSPSVCNRQSCRVYLFDEPELKRAVLATQTGNLGFGHSAAFVAAVTSRLACFTGYSERNQAFVDGGIFFMGLLLAFHSLGVGCCSLNWSATLDQDRRLRELTGIPDDEVIVSLMCGGYWPPEAEVAASPRRELSEVLVWNSRATG